MRGLHRRLAVLERHYRAVPDRASTSAGMTAEQEAELDRLVEGEITAYVAESGEHVLAVDGVEMRFPNLEVMTETERMLFDMYRANDALPAGFLELLHGGPPDPARNASNHPVVENSDYEPAASRLTADTLTNRIHEALFRRDWM